MADRTIIELYVLQPRGKFASFHLGPPIDKIFSTGTDIQEYILSKLKNRPAVCFNCEKPTVQYSDTITFGKDILSGAKGIIFAVFIPCCMSPGCTIRHIEESKKIKKLMHDGRTTKPGISLAADNISKVNSPNALGYISTECVMCKKMSDPNKPKYNVCGKCRLTYYCSRECQLMDWPRHKAYCKK